MKKLLTGLAVAVVGLSSFGQGAMIDDAVSWLYTNGYTIFSNTRDYQPNNYMRRDEAAKFFVKVAEGMGKTDYVKTESQCSFSDLNDGHADLKDVMVKSCRMGIFQGHEGKFMPTWALTNSQALAVMIRITSGYESETGVSYWADNYYKKAQSLGRLSQLPVLNTKEGLGTRGTVAQLVYNYLNNSNNTTITGIFKDNDLKLQFEYYNPDFIDGKVYKSELFDGIIPVKGRLDVDDPRRDPIFMSAHDGSEPSERGYYRGDMGKFINSQSYIDNYCASVKDNSDIKSCILKTNDHGVKYIKVERIYAVMGEDTTYNKVEYYIYNPNSTYRGIVLSTESIGIQMKNSLQLIVDSLQFIK